VLGLKEIVPKKFENWLPVFVKLVYNCQKAMS